MTKTSDSHQIAAARQLEEVAKKFAEATASIPNPSETGDLLLSLGSVQSTLSGVYAALAQWHGEVVEGVHHGGEDHRAHAMNPGWVRADVALREAAKYGEDAAEALARAHAANDVALWYEEIRDAGEV